MTPEPLKSEALLNMLEDLEEEKKKAKEAEEKFKNIFEKSADSILIADAKTKKFVEVNDQMCKYTGYSKQEFLKKGVLDIHPKKDLPYVLNEFKLQSQGKKTLAENISILRKDGKIVYADINSVPVLIKGKPFLVGTFRDITEQKQAEEELKKLKEKVEKDLLIKDVVFESSIAANSTADPKGIINIVNKSFLNLWGYKTKKEVIGKPLSYFFKNKKDTILVLKSLQKTGKWEGDFLAKRKDGSTFTSYGKATTILDKKGKLIGYQSVNLDVTQDRMREQENEDKYRDLFENANDLIQSVDQNGKFVYINKKWKQVLGYSDKEVKKLAFQNIISKEHLPMCNKIFKRIKQGETISNIETDFITKQGKKIHVEGNINAYKKNNKFFTRGIFRDITKRKQAEQRLLHLKEKYEKELKTCKAKLK